MHCRRFSAQIEMRGSGTPQGLYYYLFSFLHSVEELESEFFRDLEVASLVDSDRISKRVSTASLEGSSSTASRDSKETQN